ncbi:MAG TPA: hypothetical protein VHL53_13010 [Acidimicrobiia bacterium]|nr:hypothetical protein [Acidimicrobiia bacterium]
MARPTRRESASGGAAATALVAGLAALSGLAGPAVAAEAAPPFVAVPARYVYDPSRGSLHDYCTKSPDSWGRADFRGPCANHDLCYEDHRRGKAACDDGLERDLRLNCGVAFDQAGAGRDPDRLRTCVRIAAAYHYAVKHFGHY